jgi:uncharacterized protein
MDIEPILYQLNPWWEKTYEAPGILREKYLKKLQEEIKQKHITFITGLRRVGKTTLIKQTISKLLKEQCESKHIFFVSLDHSALHAFSILELVNKYREVQGIRMEERIYLFFDEIQYHDNFAQDLKTLHDHQNVKICASGSNALILKDKKAFLTGRNKNIIVMPLSFEEFLLFQQIKITQSNTHLNKKYFEEYLKIGGMPEYVLTRETEKIINLVNDIIHKDIIGKHKIRNTRKIEELFLLLCERVGKRVSYNKLANILGIDSETVSAYISFFEEAFLIHQIQRYTKSLNEAVHSPKKIYIADTGIKNVFVGFRDKGALMENLVFLQIKEKKPSYYYENGKEIDFIIKKR